METKVLTPDNYIFLTGDCIDIFEKNLFKLIPFGKKLLATDQAQPPHLWLKTNSIQIQLGCEITLKDLKPVHIINLTYSDNENSVQEELNFFIEKQETWMKRKLQTSISELMLNYSQHIRDLGVSAKIILAESDDIILVGLDDNLGKLNLALMNKYGLQDYSKKDYVADESKVGGGLGIYSLIKRGNLFYGQCNWKRKSKTYVGFLKNKDSKNKTVFLEEMKDASNTEQ